VEHSILGAWTKKEVSLGSNDARQMGFVCDSGVRSGFSVLLIFIFCCSLVHGRPSHITKADWDVVSLQEDDFPESAADEDDEDGSAEVEKGTLFCEMIKLTEILSLVLSNFYTLTAEREFEERAQEGIRFLLEKAKPIQLSLRQWHSELPASLKMESIVMRKLSSTGKAWLVLSVVVV
jgi:hypothetical protein